MAKKEFWRKLTIKFMAFFFIFSFIIVEPVLLPLAQIAQAEDKTVPEYANDKDPTDPGGELGKTLQSFNTSNIVEGMKELDLLANVARGKKIGLDAYDRAEIEKYTAIYEALKNDAKSMAEYKRTGQVPQKILKDLEISIDPANFDIRVLKSLIWLVTPKHRGGGGREYIKVSNIVRGYTSERRGTTSKEVDAEQEAKDSKAREYLSSHFKDLGQAVDATQADYLRGTRFVYECDDNGCSLKEKTKLPKTPIEFVWQTNEGGQAGSVPEIFGKSINELFSHITGNVMSQATLDWLSEAGVDIKLGSTLTGKNAGQVLEELGLSWLKENYDLPLDFSFGPDLSSTAKNLAAGLLAESSAGLLPKDGWQGNSFDDLLVNLGRSYVETQAGLPAGSLTGQTSQDILTSLGQRKMESELGLPEETLQDTSGGEDIYQRSGQALVESTLNLVTGSWRGANWQAISTNLASKAGTISANPALVDNLLGIAAGTTQTLINGGIDAASFNREVAKTVLDNGVNLYHQNKRDEALGIPTGSFDAFLHNGKAAFSEIGYSVLAKTLVVEEGLNNTIKDGIKNWLTTGNIPKETDAAGKQFPIFDEGYLSSLWKLKSGDLFRILGQDRAQAKEVFSRIGKTNLDLLLSGSLEAKIRNQAPPTASAEFYETRVNGIESAANGIKNGVDNSNPVASLCQDILSKITDIKQSGYVKAILKQKTRQEKIDLVQKNILAIEKLDSQKRFSSYINTIKNASDEIIEGQEIRDFSQVKEQDIKGLTPVYYASDDIKKGLLKTITEKENPGDFVTKLGLTYLADVFDFKENDVLVKAWQSIKNHPQANVLDALQRNITTTYLKETFNQVNGALKTFGYSTSTYNWGQDDLLNILAGNTVSPLLKIGGKVSNEAYGFLPGKGLKEFVEGSVSDWDTIQSAGALTRLWQFFGLTREPVTEGDVFTNVFTNLEQAYLEEGLGLAKAGLKGNIEDMIKSNGPERVLAAFGIGLPAEIASIQGSSLYDQKLQEFLTKVKSGDASVWNNASIQAAVGAYGIDLGVLKNLFTGTADASSLLGSVENTIKNRIIAQDPDGDFALDNFFDLQDIFASTGKIGSYKIDLLTSLQQTPGNIPSKLMELFKEAAQKDLDSKLGFDFDDALSMIDFFQDPKLGEKISLENGISLLSNLFNQEKKDVLQTALSGLNVAEILTPHQKSGRNIFGLVYQDGVEKLEAKINVGGIPFIIVERAFPMADKVLGGEIINVIKDFTKIKDLTNLNVDAEALRFTTGDLKGGLVSWGMAQVKNQYEKWAKDGNWSSLIDPNQILDNLKKAYFDPSALDLQGISGQADSWCNTFINGFGSFADTLKLDLATQQFDTFLNDFRRQGLQDVQYYLMDMTASQGLGALGAGPGFAKAMLQGTIEDKMGFLSNYLGRVGLAKMGELGSILGNSPLINCFTGGSCLNDADLQNWLLGNQGIVAGIEQKLRELTGWGLLPSGFFNSLLGFKTGGFNFNLDLTGLPISSLNGLLQNIQPMIGNWLDKSLNLAMGSTFSLWQQFESFKGALDNYANILKTFNAADLGNSLQQLVGAQQALNLQSANAIVIATNLLFGKTFSQLDQSLGLPPGTTAMIVGALITSVVTGAAFGASLLALAGGPVGVIIMVVGAVMGFGGAGQKTTKVEIIYTACGYYPGFQQEQTGWDEQVLTGFDPLGGASYQIVHHEGVSESYQTANSSGKIEDWSHLEDMMEQYDIIPAQEVETGCPGEFHAETKELFQQGAKSAAIYKIRVALGNLLEMDEKIGDETILPTRLETYTAEDVKFWTQKRDEKYGYKDAAGKVITGSADQRIRDGSRKGFSYNKILFDRIHFSW